jgi:hypothetical protein
MATAKYRAARCDQLDLLSSRLPRHTTIRAIIRCYREAGPFDLRAARERVPLCVDAPGLGEVGWGGKGTRKGQQALTSPIATQPSPELQDTNKAS